MSRALIVVTVATLTMLGLVGVVRSQTPGPCTWIGTPERDVKTGTAAANVLCSLAGNDFVHAKAGNDVIRAGAGRDTIVGGSGKDTLRGGKGRDRLFAVDDRGGELLVGGRGIDQCFADPGDRTRGCERTFRSDEPEMATALDSSLGTVMSIVEEGLPPIEPTVTVTQPPVTIVTTVTHTASFPACSPPPPVTAAPCAP